jgi:hypothetical protein
MYDGSTVAICAASGSGMSLHGLPDVSPRAAPSLVGPPSAPYCPLMAIPETPPAGSPPRHWADVLAGVMRIEIDAGREVQVVLPGLAAPLQVDTASRWLDLLVVRGPDQSTYHVADPAGVVVICAPPRKLEPGEKPYWMQVDEPGWKHRKDR